jgi:putative acyl-CoA dehydrogenase
LMGLIYGTQAHSFGWTHRDERGAHVARAALSYMWNQGENGICCPMGMTFASIPALQHDKGLYDEWTPQILKATYDDRPIYAKKKNGMPKSLFPSLSAIGTKRTCRLHRTCPLSGVKRT